MDILFKLAVLEGEGIGTAYEYVQKLKFISKTITEIPRSILIFGLPEKYGLSSDFIFFSGLVGSKLKIIDDRPEKIKQIDTVVDFLGDIFPALSKKTNIEVCKICDFHDAKKYDIILSSEVLQRIDKKAEYFRKIRENSKRAIIFLPNDKNFMHRIVSGLGHVPNKKIMQLCGSLGLRVNISYLDCPPLIPGIRIKGVGKEARMPNVMKIFQLFEDAMPLTLKKILSHIKCLSINC
jgi:hypothetical protein